MKDEKLLDRILDGYHEEMCVELETLLKMRTVTSEPKPGAPFGEAIGNALLYIVKLGKEKGYDCLDFDGYASEINFGTGQESVGIASHLDVVPEGKGWKYDPFGGEIVDDRIYGRGSVDDKGPLIAVFYACLALKESGILLTKKVKQIIGTDEETGRFHCIKHYKENGKVPSCGIVPDSWFPAVYAEKGFVNYRLIKELTAKDVGDLNLIDIKGGEAYNVVASEAHAEFKSTPAGRKTIEEAFSAFLRKDENAKGSITVKNESVYLKFKGKAAHASVPEDGVNAISYLLRFLENLNFYPSALCFSIHKLAQKVGYDSTGEGLGISFTDHTGSLTNNIGMISLDRQLMEVKLNLRCPVTLNVDKFCSDLIEAADDAVMTFNLVEYNPHYYVEPDNPNLQMLVNIYRDVTGDLESKPKAHGGGSYARTLDGFIPFGPSFQSEPLLFHKQDEYITKERLLLLSKIYVRAIYEMAK